MTQTVYGSVTQKASYFSYFFTVTAVPNTEENYSDVTVSHYWQTSRLASYFDTYAARPASITIHDEVFSIFQRFSVGTEWANGNPYLIQTASKRIYHDSDGSKQIIVATRANGTASTFGPSASTDSADDCVASAMITLDTIPRASVFTVTPSVICDGESAVTVTAVKAAAAFRHRVTLSVGDKAWTSDLFDAETSYVIPKDWNHAVADGSSGTVSTVLTTYSDSTGTSVVGSSSDGFSLIVPDTAEFYPAASDFIITAINDNPTVNGWGIHLQSFTKFGFSCTASAPYGAEIVRYQYVGFSTKTESETPEAVSPVMASPGTGTFLATVTDSRGRTAQIESGSVTVKPYAKPVISNPICFRCESDGNASANGTAVFLSAIAGIASCDGQNTADLRCHYRASTVSSFTTDDYFTLTSAVGEVFGDSMFDASQDYAFKFVLTDSLGGETESTEFIIEAADVLLNATDNEHLGIFGFADPSKVGATIFKPVHFTAGATGIIDVKTETVTVSLLGLSIPVNFIRSGNVTTMVFGVRLAASATAGADGILVAIPSGFEPCDQALTGENTTTALWGRGGYLPDLLGGLSLYQTSVRIYADFTKLTPAAGWTVGATMTWINA